MNEQEFIIETKLDGERFMLHKQDNMFKYFSRGLVEIHLCVKIIKIVAKQQFSKSCKFNDKARLSKRF
jgi:ATP-dependent DNA ligase